MAFGQLWGFIKYSHPDLAFQGTAWDEAFAQTVPAVLAARSTAEYGAAVDLLLHKLDDPVTRVVSNDHKLTSKRPASYFAIDAQPHVTVVHFGDITDRSTWDAAKSRLADLQLPEARALILDVSGNWNEGGVNRFFENVGMNTLLVATELPGPGTCVRIHTETYPPEMPSVSFPGLTQPTRYLSGLASMGFTPFFPKPHTRQIPCAFIVSGQIPSVAFALQEAGLAAIFAIGRDYEPHLANFADRKLPDNVIVRTRLGTLVGAGGVRIAPFATVADASTALTEAQRWLAEPSTRNVPQKQATRSLAFSPKDDTAGEPTPLPRRLLAAFRAWAIIEYFFPYKNLMDASWSDCVRAALPALINAPAETDYHVAIRRLMVHLNDGHVTVTSNVLAGYFGSARPPLRLRMIEGAPVITKIVGSALAPASRLAVGDQVLTIGGKPWRELYAERAPLFAASTPQVLDLVVLNTLLLGPPESHVNLKLRDLAGTERDVDMVRKSEYRSMLLAPNKDEAVHLLRPDIGYADLTRLKVADVAAMYERFRETRGIIFDMRGYPSLSWREIEARLVDRAGVPAVRLEVPVFAPGYSGRGSGSFGRLQKSYMQNVEPPSDIRYAGRTVLLIDENAASASENIGMHLRAANGTVFIGSPTAGQNGNVTNFGLPGGITVQFTGLGVAWPNGDQLQRVGLKPDVLARPTKAGLAAGRDEVLEAALAYLDGSAK